MATIESTCRGFRVISSKINFRSHSRLTQEEAIKLKIKVEKEEQPNREERIEIVNKIIEKIASLDRQFFSNGEYLKDKSKKVVEHIRYKNKKYYFYTYGHNIFCLSVNKSALYERWHHGGTLLGLCKDFLDFIKTGKKSNGKNGYGGLYCQNWGYSEQSMKEIQDYAKELGYL